MRPLFITLLLSFLALPGISHADGRHQAIVDSLNTALSAATSPADSLPILYDLYDIGSRSDKRALDKLLYGVTRRTGDTAACIELLEQLASFYIGNDSVQALLQAEMERMPASLSRDEGLTFVRLMRETTRSRVASDTERREYLHKALEAYSSTTTDSIYEKIENLFTVCITIRRDSHGELMNDFLTNLDRLVNALPRDQYALRNLYYTRAAQNYTDSREFDRAVQADKHLLSIMDNLQKGYLEKGRRFRNYNTNRYVSYRRMLSNYPALSSSEIEDYYQHILDLAEIDEDVKKDLAGNNLATIYYLMATKRYDEALPLLKPYLEKQGTLSPVAITKLYKFTEEAARATGDNPTLIKAMDLYLRRLEEMADKSLDYNNREVKLISDYVKLQEKSARMESLVKEGAIAEHRRSIVIISVAAVLLLILATFIFIQYRHARRLSVNLANSNSDLRNERDRLEESRHELTDARDEARRANRVKSDFISNISHEISEPLTTIAGFSQMIVDSVDDDKRHYLERYANIVNLNIDLVQSLLSDVLNLSEIDAGKMRISIQSVSVHQMCTMAVDSVRLRLEPGVELKFTSASQPDLIVATDRRRVEQVLINLLQNATKFTTQGTISLSYEADETSGWLTFAVTDTGVGIPEGKHEVIFGRYEKLDPGIHGSGLGLTICRLIARLLKGEVWADPSYTGGARFYFRIPLSVKG